ncbi:MAG: aspartate-semialdehyde dehydrogenase [Defluviitaleaceae bacterium]|nr:aspartate-semialdehyde dehydrogenase [Defluviitaleaceae bacterium]
MKPFTCAVVGASGMVGKMMVQMLEERGLPVSALYLFASARSAGTTFRFRGADIAIEELTETSFDRGIDVALFAVSNGVSRQYAPIAAAKGCIVVDNSSAWRMDDDVPLVVPEVNGSDLAGYKGIIANPNCCACPAVVALKPLHDAYGLRRVVISTYQAVSGAGVPGPDDLTATLKGEAPKHFPHPIAHNLIPHIGDFDENGYTGEETKLMAEVRKMLHLPDLAITATTVRVPVYNGHSLSINATFDKPFQLVAICNQLKNAPGITLVNNLAEKIYPMPITASGTDTVHIGRVRRDDSEENGLNMWVVSDNIRKGAALNAVQIVEQIFS